MARILEKEMHNYFTQLNEAEKKSVVKMLKTFLKKRNNTGSRISIEQYNEELDKALIEVKKREVYSHEEVVKKARNW